MAEGLAAAPPHRRKRIVYLFNTGRLKRLDEAKPGEFFYGYRSLSRERFEATLFEPHPPTQGIVNDRGEVYPLPRWLRWLPRRLKPTRLTLVTRLLQVVFAGLGALRRADVIVAVTSPWIHATGLVRRLGLLRVPVVGVAIGPFRAPHTLRGRALNALQRFLFAGANLVFIGDADRSTFLQYISPRPRRAELIYFAVDENFWHPAADEEAGDYVFAIGTAGRDYDTLFAAWDGRTDKLKIVTGRLDPEASYGAGIEVAYGMWHSARLSDDAVRDLYWGARYVVTPLVEGSQPYGQSATLQAMACAKAVVLTRTAGLWDSAAMQHLENCYLVEPGDVAGLKAALGYLDTRPDEVARIGRNARATVDRQYSIPAFTRRFEDLLNSVIDTS
jgi:glycosyltransferase involved in cell wall biosynthesis